ncbi:MAG: cyclic nucleotide-binding domain-containing protein [Acidobacteriota bacterium]
MSLVAPSTSERLREVPLVKGLPDDVLGALRPNLYQCRFEAGEVILREGDYCDGAYYLIDGCVEVRFRREAAPTVDGPPRKPKKTPRLRWPFSSSARKATAGDSGAAVVLAEVPLDLAPGERALLEPGDIFAEGSALSRYPIATDIVAVSPVECLLIRTPALRQMLDLPELASFKAMFDERYRQRTLRAHLHRVPVFKGLPGEVIERLIASVDLVTYKPGRVIVEQGSTADAFYLVRGGYVKVGVKMGAGTLAATYLRKGDWIGETTVLLDEPWPFSLTALEHVELVRLSRDMLREILAEAPGVEARLWDTMLTRLKQVRQAVAQPLMAQPLQFAMDSGLIHGESVLLINLETCTRCDECVRACADAHEGLPKFVREGVKFRNFSVPTACYQCTDPVCMIGCPTGAITRPLGTLEVVIDKATCIGCSNCVRRCPWGNIHQVPYDNPSMGERVNLATKCDLCVGRSDGPACVQMCPHGAAIRVSFKEHDLVNSLFSHGS